MPTRFDADQLYLRVTPGMTANAPIALLPPPTQAMIVFGKRPFTAVATPREFLHQ